MSLAPDIPQLRGCGIQIMWGVFTVLVLMLGFGMYVLSGTPPPPPPVTGPVGPGQNAPGNGGGGGAGGAGSSASPAGPSAASNVVPSISDRFFSTGQAQAEVSGDFGLNLSLGVDSMRSYAQDGLGWIAFDSGGTEVLIALNEPENSVTVAQGDTSVTGIDDDCTFQIVVTEANVSGHISCPEVDVITAGEPAGVASIELDFSAELAPPEE